MSETLGNEGYDDIQQISFCGFPVMGRWRKLENKKSHPPGEIIKRFIDRRLKDAQPLGAQMLTDLSGPEFIPAAAIETNQALQLQTPEA